MNFQICIFKFSNFQKFKFSNFQIWIFEFEFSKIQTFKFVTIIVSIIVSIIITIIVTIIVSIIVTIIVTNVVSIIVTIIVTIITIIIITLFIKFLTKSDNSVWHISETYCLSQCSHYFDTLNVHIPSVKSYFLELILFRIYCNIFTFANYQFLLLNFIKLILNFDFHRLQPKI